MEERQQNQKRENPGFQRKCPHLRARGVRYARMLRRRPVKATKPEANRRGYRASIAV
jgi:hypothetical protein